MFTEVHQWNANIIYQSNLHQQYRQVFYKPVCQTMQQI